MPILVKGDDIRHGTKAKAYHGRLQVARESMVKYWAPKISWLGNFEFTALP